MANEPLGPALRYKGLSDQPGNHVAAHVRGYHRLSDGEPGSGRLEGRRVGCGAVPRRVVLGKQEVIVDPATRSVRTNLMRNDRLATVVSCWLSPP